MCIDHILFQLITVCLKILKPEKTSLDRGCLTCLAKRMVRHLLLVPVFVQKSGKKLFHRHLTDSIHIQIRQHTCNVIQ